MYLTITTKKCPCGYVYKEEVKSEIRKFQTTGLFIDNHTPRMCNILGDQEEIVSKATIMGDKNFQKANIFGNNDIIICPKCGTLLLSSIATTTTKEEIK